ncbi:MAG: hypothetical protein FWE42_05830 [Defluviitaleaceae bacterium]|nr:hypothetical protein [Defluviitaleaceae bacterium]
MKKEIKEALYQQMKTSEPNIEDIIRKYITDENTQKPILHYIAWLKSNGTTPQYADFEGQSPFWEVEYNGKKHYIVWDGKDTIRIMIQVAFSKEYQAIICENNLQDIILTNLQYCSRPSGGECGNCHLPPGIHGVGKIIFGKEIKNLCCGQFTTFQNPYIEAIEAIKLLLK